METIRRSHYVNHVLADASVGWNKEGLTPIIRAVSELIGNDMPPSWMTLYRWLRDYESAGRDVRALAPAVKARGNRRGKTLSEYSDEDYERARDVDDRIDQVGAPYYSPGAPIMTEWRQNFGTTETQSCPI